MTMQTTDMHAPKRKLPLASEISIDAELKNFEKEERERLGLDGVTEHWIEDMANKTFTKKEKANITMLVSGLTMAHDYFVSAALTGVGYHVQMLDCPNTDALQFGKEFGNRGQCNPTYFTVGNLVKFLCTLRDKHGMSAESIIQNYVFLTAGACGPCRFGMYVTEYRKALRDAGFDGFRVVLFQQTGGLSQATGEDSGLEMNPTFFWGIIKALIAGDVINALGYRVRPYEVNKGDTDQAIEAAKKIIYEALLHNTNVLKALWEARALFASVKVDRTVAKPKVSIIGEFWAMTTEGDGNYHLQRFLESEGAEVDVQLVSAWLLYTVWEFRHDTKDRQYLKAEDSAKYGLGGMGPFGVAKRMANLVGAELAIRGLFQTFANVAGLTGYHLPDMNRIAEISHEYYNNDLRGGEGHMEVGKLIMNFLDSKAHMTLSVKPFGCMPSAGVSDGVQSAITEKFPGTIFCPVETSGDGKVNFYSRVLMYLFKAKQAAAAEYERALTENGVALGDVKAFLASHPEVANALHKAPHRYSGTAADLVAEVAPYITKSRVERAYMKAGRFAQTAKTTLSNAPAVAKSVVASVVNEGPVVVSRLREDVLLIREARAASKASKAAQAVKTATPAYPVASFDAAAE